MLCVLLLRGTVPYVVQRPRSLVAKGDDNVNVEFTEKASVVCNVRPKSGIIRPVVLVVDLST